MTSSRSAELVKGLLTVGPLFFGLIVLATTLVLLTSTIGVHATWPGWVMLSAFCIVLVATTALSARYWNHRLPAVLGCRRVDELGRRAEVAAGHEWRGGHA